MLEGGYCITSRHNIGLNHSQVRIKPLLDHAGSSKTLEKATNETDSTKLARVQLYNMSLSTLASISLFWGDGCDLWECMAYTVLCPTCCRCLCQCQGPPCPSLCPTPSTPL